MATERQLKGINFLGTLEALEREHQRETRECVVASLEGEVGDAIRGSQILASSWYPAAWYDTLLQTIVLELRGDSDTARTLARDAVKSDFGMLFKILRLFMSPEQALQQAMRVSSSFMNDGGVVDVVQAGGRMMQLRLREYHGYTHLMWWDFIGGIEGVLSNMGAQDITSRIMAGGDDGEHHLEVMLRWRL